jgi:hypothetical protein
MAPSSGSTSTSYRSGQLVVLAQAEDPASTERTLEFWRHQGLLPRPQRGGQEGKRPVWVYPPETGDQLRALLRLRRQTKDPNVLRAALWYEGYPVDTARVRSSISAHLRQLLDAFDKELAKRQTGADSPEARWEAIQAVAKVLAGKRGKGFPRLARQALSERSSGIALMLGLLLNDDEAMRHLEADAPAVERLIGVDRGRRFRPNGKGPWLDGPAHEGLASFAQMGSLTRLIAVVEGSTDQEMEVARHLGRTLLGGISAFARIAEAMEGRDNASGMAGMTVVDGDPQAAMVIVPLVLSILSSTELAEGLRQVLDALQGSVLPVEARVKELAALPEEEQADRLRELSHLPFAEQVSVKRLLADYSEKQPREGR